MGESDCKAHISPTLEGVVPRTTLRWVSERRSWLFVAHFHAQITSIEYLPKDDLDRKIT